MVSLGEVVTVVISLAMGIFTNKTTTDDVTEINNIPAPFNNQG